MNKIFALAFLVIPLLSFSQSHQYEAGLVYGPKAAFQICAPEGWVVDNKSGLGQGLPCVLYLDSSTWANSPVVMYAKIASPRYPEREEFIEFAYQSFKRQIPNFARTELDSLVVGDFVAKIYRYENPLYHSFEATAYFQVENAVCYLVFSTKEESMYDAYFDAFIDAVISFKYRPDFIDYSGEPLDEQTLQDLCNDK